MLLLADDPNIKAAPLPVLVAIVALGFLVLGWRSEVLKHIAEATVSGPFGRRYAWTPRYRASEKSVVRLSSTQPT